LNIEAAIAHGDTLPDERGVGERVALSRILPPGRPQREFL
jgi:hypothetical protein